MWVRFEKDFDFSPAAHGGRVTIAYTAGTVANVTRECVRKAGDRAVRTKAPGRASTPSPSPSATPLPLPGGEDGRQDTNDGEDIRRG